MHGRSRLPHGAFDLGVTGMTDENQSAPLRHIMLGLGMNLRHERAGCIDDRKLPRFCFKHDRLRHAMCAEHGHRPVRHLIQFLDESGAFLLQGFDDVLIVDDFVPDKYRLAVLLKGAFDDVDCPNHSCTETARLGENHAH